MVLPTRRSSSSSTPGLGWFWSCASVLAATSSAGVSMNFSARFSRDSKTSTSRRRPSCPQASRRNAGRRPSSTSSAAWNKRSMRCQRSGSITLLLAQLAQEPNLGQLPISHHRIGRNLQHFGGLLHAQPPKKSQLYHAALSLVNSGQVCHCVVHRDQIAIRLTGDHQPFVQWDVHGISAPLLETARACEIGENTTHQLRAHSEKMRPVLPVDFPDIHQP